MGGNSGEFFLVDESLIEQFCVEVKDLRVVNFFSQKRSNNSIWEISIGTNVAEVKETLDHLISHPVLILGALLFTTHEHLFSFISLSLFERQSEKSLHFLVYKKKEYTK
jgi:hypothetical protein